MRRVIATWNDISFVVGLDNVIGNMRANIPKGNTQAIVSSTTIQAYTFSSAIEHNRQADRGIRIGVFKFEAFSNNRNRGRPVWNPA